MSDPNPLRPDPTRSRALLLALLLALTLASGAAARWGVAPGDPSSDPVTQPPRNHAGPVSLAARIDRTRVLEGGDGLLRMELRLAADAAAPSGARLLPTDLVVVLDRSGSMQGAPLQSALAGVHELVDRLGPEDRFALVTYATGGEVTIGLETAGSEARQRWKQQLGAIYATGGTEMSRGLDLAHALVEQARTPGRVPRVVLLSDGHANQGDASAEGLRARAARAVGGEYVLSTAGVGLGFDEALMSALADAGTGNFYYLPDATALGGVFDREFSAARETLASSLEVEIAPGPGVRVQDAAGYPLLRDGQRVRFRPGDLAAGQERRIWLTLHVPTDTPAELALGAVSVAFEDRGGERQTLSIDPLPRIACVADPDAFYASFDRDTYLAAGKDTLGRLKQQVAGLIADGRQDEAVAEVEKELDARKHEQLRALGYVSPGEVTAYEALRDTLAAPEAAAPQVQQRLGKSLLEAGRDERRAGSKHR